MKNWIVLLAVLTLSLGMSAQAADTLYTSDTVVIVDTVYVFDTCVAVQKQLFDMKSEFYDHAVEALEYRKSSIDRLFVVAGIIVGFLSLVLIIMMYLTQRSRERVDKEIDEIRARRLDIDRVYDEILERKKEVKKMALELTQTMAEQIEAAETKAEEKRITDPEERIKLIKESDARESVEEYEKLLSSKKLQGISEDIIPTSLHRSVGKNYYKLEMYDKAIKEFLIYLASNPTDGEITFYVAYAYSELGQNLDAISYYKKVLQLNPADSYACNNWGTALDDLYEERKDAGLLDEAIEKYKKAVEIDPNDDSAYTNWGTALAHLYRERKDAGLLEESIEKYKRAIEINPRNDSAYSNWGNALISLYQERKDAALVEEAIEKYKRAIEINPTNDTAYSNWGSALADLYRERKDADLLEEAIRKCDKALEINPEEGGTHYNKACAFSLLKRKNEMLLSLKTAIGYDPKYKEMAREDKDFHEYWDAPDFIALTLKMMIKANPP